MRASRYFVIDPLRIREGLSVIPLGHLTYLEAKAEGDNSMSGKAESREAAYLPVRRGSIGTVKAGLLEPQCPKRNLIDLEEQRKD
jgi:hypothetical protein